MKKGFTLVEILVTIAIFVLIFSAITTTYAGVFRLISANKTKIAALDLADEQIEIIRNVPYAQVGEVSGVPSGVFPHLQTLVRNGLTFQVTTTIRNIDDPFDGTLGSSTNNDTSPADYKLVQVDIACATCQNYTPVSLTTYVAPKNLESASTNGSLFINAFDANGNPVAQANVHVVDASSSIVIDDVTNDSGILQIVGTPPDANVYNITVTKSGYSTDATYPVTVSNPKPTKPNATVAVQKVTSVSFAIDKLSTINFQSLSPTCSVVPNISFNLSGTKTIGQGILKYTSSQSTNASGILSLPGLEWDTYNMQLVGTSYDLMGTNPLLPTSLLPNATQNFQLVLGPWNPSSLLVEVEDSVSGLPLTGATVSLTQGANTQTSATGRGFIKQTDWSGGAGQSDVGTTTKYANNDGNIDTTTLPGAFQLRKSSGSYVASGILESSTFDMGTSTNFQQILWNPTSQPAQTGTSSVRFQIAVSNVDTATTTWNYVGPDSTAATYFTTANQNINVAQNGTRYIRYKAYLSTASSTYTPSVSDVEVTYTSGCLPPGQAYFSGLSSGSYTLVVSNAGYTTSSTTVTVGSTSTRQIVLMNTQ